MRAMATGLPLGRWSQAVLQLGLAGMLVPGASLSWRRARLGHHPRWSRAFAIGSFILAALNLLQAIAILLK
jgi:hypothetical protein